MSRGSMFVALCVMLALFAPAVAEAKSYLGDGV
mgnify:CR=1 FL=1